jgi:MFS family permease
MLLMLTPALLPAAAGFFLRGLFIAASYPQNDALVMRATPPRQRGMAMSAMSVLWAGGWAASAALAGWVRAQTGSFTPIILTAAVCYALSALAIVTLPVSDEAPA